MLYNIKRKLFKWNLDSDNDLMLSICGIIHLTKYKDTVLFSFGNVPRTEAPKNLNIRTTTI
jgi:hypothetical protein